jgi:HEPN domain-containing protein
MAMRDGAEDYERAAKTHAAAAAGAIVEGNYSYAAAECHRAYQAQLQANAYRLGHREATEGG